MFFKYCAAAVLGLRFLTGIQATVYDGYQLDVIGNNLAQPTSLALVPSSGNLWFANPTNGPVNQISPAGVLLTSFDNWGDIYSTVSVDSSGVLVTSGQYNSYLQLMRWNDGYGSPSQVYFLPQLPVSSICTQIAGTNLFCYTAGDSLYMTPVPTTYNYGLPGFSPTTLYSSLSSPKSLCVDPNVTRFYVACANGVSVISTAGVLESTITSPADAPNICGVAVDSVGNVYFGGGGNVYVQSSGGVISQIISGLTSVQQMCVDAENNLYIADAGSSSTANGFIYKLTPPPVLEIDFTNGAQLTAPITGGLKFAGIGDCTFLGSATAGIEINAGNVKVASATPLGTSGVNMTGGSLEATAALTTPALTITNNTTVKASANNVRVATAGGNGSLTLTGAVGNEIVYLDKIASTGGVSSAANRVRFTNLTNLHANTATFGYRLGLDGLPTSNVYGTGAVTAAELIVNTPTVPAGAFGSLTTSRIFLGSNSINQAIIAGSSS